MKHFGEMWNRLRNQGGERKEKEVEPSGFEKYKHWCEQLRADFERNFDSADNTKTQDIYNQAKRLYRITEGTGHEIAYSGIFGDSQSRLGPIAPNRLSERNQEALVMGGQVKIWLEEIDHSMTALKEVAHEQTLEKERWHIVPLQSAHLNVRLSDDSPFTKNYLEQLRDQNRRAEEYASTLRNVQDTQSIIRKEDLQAISGLYRSLRLDRDFWRTFYDDIVSTDPKVYNGGFLSNLSDIRFQYLGKICDSYERAYSKDSLSEGDKGTEWILGTREDANLRATFDEDQISDVHIPDDFADHKSYFRILGIDPTDVVGKTHQEIKTLLRSSYYALAKGCHPDLHLDNREKEEEFKKLDEAYKVLVDPSTRANYIRHGS